LGPYVPLDSDGFDDLSVAERLVGTFEEKVIYPVARSKLIRRTEQSKLIQDRQ